MQNSIENQVQQKFSRYEFKYILNNRLSKEIEKEVIHFMKYDGYLDPKLENQYIVRSLYFDNYLASNFYEKVDGIKKRSKYRIRTYARDIDEKKPIFLEEKGRLESRTFKNRSSLSVEDLDFFQGYGADQFNLNYQNSDFFSNFLYSRARKSLSPCVLVDYHRRPYTNIHGLYFRLTFDSNISASSANELFPDNNTQHWRQCLHGYTILEVKFDRAIPPWFHRIIQAYQLNRVSVSKFVLGMKDCGIAVDL